MILDKPFRSLTNKYEWVSKGRSLVEEQTVSVKGLGSEGDVRNSVALV